MHQPDDMIIFDDEYLCERGCWEIQLAFSRQPSQGSTHSNVNRNVEWRYWMEKHCNNAKLASTSKVCNVLTH